MKIPIQTYPAIERTGAFRAAFVCRIPGVDPTEDRAEMLRRLADAHTRARHEVGLGATRFVTAQQVHGGDVAVVDETSIEPVPTVDSLVTAQPGVCLGIYVADCCAVFFVDPRRRAVGLAHSGKKGTDLGIVTATIEKMQSVFGSEPRDLIVQLSPCIRPPQYGIDFAAGIVAQCRAAGVHALHDAGENTGADLGRFYSYRMERGRTGRMLALLAVTGRPAL